MPWCNHHSNHKLMNMRIFWLSFLMTAALRCRFAHDPCRADREEGTPVLDDSRATCPGLAQSRPGFRRKGALKGTRPATRISPLPTARPRSPPTPPCMDPEIPTGTCRPGQIRFEGASMITSSSTITNTPAPLRPSRRARVHTNGVTIIDERDGTAQRHLR